MLEAKLLHTEHIVFMSFHRHNPPNSEFVSTNFVCNAGKEGGFKGNLSVTE